MRDLVCFDQHMLMFGGIVEMASAWKNIPVGKVVVTACHFQKFATHL